MLPLLKKMQDMYLKHKIVFSLAISTVLFMLSTLWYPITALNVAFLTVTFMVSPVNEILYYLIYYIMFSRSTVFFVLIAVTAFLCIMVKFVNSIIKKEIVLAKMSLIITTIIAVLFSLINYSIKFEGVCQGALIIGILYLGYMIFCYRKEIDAKKLFVFLFIGIISSLVVSFILYNIPKAEILFYDTDDFYLKPVRDMIFIKETKFKRLMLLSYHPNHLNCYCTFLMCFILYQLINKDSISIKELCAYLISYAICLIIGILTISKAFLLCTALSACYGILFLIIKHKKQSWKYVVPIILTIVIVGSCLFKIIMVILGRFHNDGNIDDEIISTITTGRTDIWKQYFRCIFSSPWKALFGFGIFASEVVAIGAHNMYIAVLYRFGFVGVALLIVLFISYYLECKDLHFSFYKFLPLFLFLVYSLQEVSIDERFIFLFLAIMLLFEKNNDSIKNDNALNQIDSFYDENFNSEKTKKMSVDKIKS